MTVTALGAGRQTRRHLRIYWYDHMADEVMSLVLLARAKVPGTRYRAAELLGPAHADRRLAVQEILAWARKQRGSVVRAVAVVACPNPGAAAHRRPPGKQHATPTTIYQASFAVAPQWSMVLVSEARGFTVASVRTMLEERIGAVLLDGFDPAHALRK